MKEGSPSGSVKRFQNKTVLFNYNYYNSIIILHKFGLQNHTFMISKDLLWKGIIEDLTEPFIEYFFPKYCHHIDWAKPVVFLDAELSRMFNKVVKGKKVADKLIKVFLKDGEPHIFLIHVEIQSQSDTNMGHRIYTMYHRIMDKYNAKVTSLVILVYKNAKDTRRYKTDFMGTKIIFTYNVYNLVKEIENSSYDKKNIFSYITRAAYIDIKYEDNESHKFLAKTKLWRELLNQKIISKEKYLLLLNFIDESIRFKDEAYQMKNREFIKSNEKIKNMGLMEILKLERDKEIKKEVRKGEKRGKLEGKLEGKTEIILKSFDNGIDIPMIANITSLTEKEVKAILKKSNKIK